jgi:hypothetical protein
MAQQYFKQARVAVIKFVLVFGGGGAKRKLKEK